MVHFTIGHTGDHILLTYFVEEKYIRATNTQDNEAVYEDTCVEFFVSFGDTDAYYNIECNCVGSLLIGHGKDRFNRILLPDLKKIQRTIIMERTANNDFHWELNLKIPIDVFGYDKLSSLGGMSARGNFYKCGDLLPEPHFLCWNPILAPVPDFHLPEYFGELIFEPTINEIER